MTTDAEDSAKVDSSPSATPVTREDLYKLVWSRPMTKVAAKYGVSSSYLARVCALLNVPRPARGYWAKLAAGKAPANVSLPGAMPGDTLAWSRQGEPLRAPPSPPRPPSAQQKKIRIRMRPSNDLHALLDGAKSHYEGGRLSYEVGYLKPSKRLLVDLTVTATGLDKALLFANQLFQELEARGHHVVIAPRGEYLQRPEIDEREQPRGAQRYNNLWSPARSTIVYVGTVAIGMTIIEMSEELEARYVNGTYIREADYVPPKRTRHGTDRTWTTTKSFGSGRLCLQAYSPYPRAKWTHQWRETRDQTLSSRIPAIVKEFAHAASEISTLVEEGERQAAVERERWDAQQEKWRREEAERRAAKAIKDSREELLLIVATWADSRRIREFLAEADRQIAVLSDDEKAALVDRLNHARDLISGDNALDRLRNWRSPNER